MTDAQMARVYEEQALSDARIVEESHCDLRVSRVLHRDDPDAFNDHVSTYLECTDPKCTCSKYFVATDFVNGRCDIRPMSEDERKRYA